MISFVHLLCLAVAVRASPLPSHVLQHARSAPPRGFTLVEAATADQQMTFRVALKANNISGLEARLATISDPHSATYRQWLSADEVSAHMQPSQDSVAAFNAFAHEHGLQATAAGGHGEWMSFTTNVSHANTLFAASFHQFQHESAAAPITRTLSYSLPLALADHVDTVHPMTTFDAPASRRSGSRKGRAPGRRQQSSDPVVTPLSLQKLYNIPLSAANSSGVSILVTGYFDEIPQIADIQNFLRDLRTDIDPQTPLPVISLDGGLATQDPSVADTQDDEALLDAEYVMGIAAGIPASFLSVGGDTFSTALFDTTTFLTTTANPPTVVTTSYALDEARFSTQDMQKICSGYMAAGARGTSVIFSSGDNGVHQKNTEESCSDDTFVVQFPPSCPYVTAVGGTTGLSPETAAPFSAGGFSNMFTRPTYQDSSATAFLSTIRPNFPGIFARGGRGYPDVSLQSRNYRTIEGQTFEEELGTSASAPTFASMIALLNAQLMADGHASLGFLNPFIYSVAGPAGAFNDVTAGSNLGFGAGDGNVCDAATSSAFTAVQGWDAVTGWGTPDYLRLLQAAKRGSGTTATTTASSSVSTSATAGMVSQAPNVATTKALPTSSTNGSAPSGTANTSSSVTPAAVVVNQTKGNGSVTTSRSSATVLLLTLLSIVVFGL